MVLCTTFFLFESARSRRRRFNIFHTFASQKLVLFYHFLLDLTLHLSFRKKTHTRRRNECCCLHFYLCWNYNDPCVSCENVINEFDGIICWQRANTVRSFVFQFVSCLWGWVWVNSHYTLLMMTTTTTTTLRGEAKRKCLTTNWHEFNSFSLNFSAVVAQTQ